MTPTVAILGSGVRWPSGGAPGYLADAARDGVAIAGVGLRAPLFPYTPADHVLVEAVHLDAGLRALDTRPAAIFIDTFGEYALDALRAAVAVPVIGAAHAAIDAASRHGPRFAIVTVWPSSLAWLYDARLARHGAGARCTGVTYTGDSRAHATDATAAVEHVRGEVASGAAALIDRVIEDCRAAIARGADSIVLGCTCMAPMYDALVAGVGAPVVCASRAGLAASIDAARRWQAAGRPGERAPDASLVRNVRAAVSALSMAGASGASDDEVPADAGTGCPVCVTAD
jgi:allantoin racemase